MDSLRPVVRRFEPAQHLLPLEELFLSRGHVVVIDGFRRGHRAIGIANQRRVEVVIVGRVGHVGRLIEGQVVLPASGPRQDAYLEQALLSLHDHQLILENLEVSQEHIVTVGDEVPPVLASGGCDRRLHQAEILGIGIGANVEIAPVVIDVVFVVALARLENLKFSVGSLRVQDAVLGGERLYRGDQDVFF